MELTLDEQTLVNIFRTLDDCDKKELLRHAALQRRAETACTAASISFPAGQCRLERGGERPETISEPIFTE